MWIFFVTRVIPVTFRRLRNDGLSAFPEWVVFALVLLAGLASLALIAFLIGWGLQKGRRAADGG